MQTYITLTRMYINECKRADPWHTDLMLELVANLDFDLDLVSNHWNPTAPFGSHNPNHNFTTVKAFSRLMLSEFQLFHFLDECNAAFPDKMISALPTRNESNLHSFSTTSAFVRQLGTVMQGDDDLTKSCTWWGWTPTANPSAKNASFNSLRSSSASDSKLGLRVLL